MDEYSTSRCKLDPLPGEVRPKATNNIPVQQATSQGVEKFASPVEYHDPTARVALTAKGGLRKIHATMAGVDLLGQGIDRYDKWKREKEKDKTSPKDESAIGYVKDAAMQGVSVLGKAKKELDKLGTPLEQEQSEYNRKQVEKTLRKVIDIIPYDIMGARTMATDLLPIARKAVAKRDFWKQKELEKEKYDKEHGTSEPWKPYAPYRYPENTARGEYERYEQEKRISRETNKTARENFPLAMKEKEYRQTVEYKKQKKATDKEVKDAIAKVKSAEKKEQNKGAEEQKKDTVKQSLLSKALEEIDKILPDSSKPVAEEVFGKFNYTTTPKSRLGDAIERDEKTKPSSLSRALKEIDEVLPSSMTIRRNLPFPGVKENLMYRHLQPKPESGPIEEWETELKDKESKAGFLNNVIDKASSSTGFLLSPSEAQAAQKTEEKARKPDKDQLKEFLKGPAIFRKPAKAILGTVKKITNTGKQPDYSSVYESTKKEIKISQEPKEKTVNASNKKLSSDVDRYPRANREEVIAWQAAQKKETYTSPEENKATVKPYQDWYINPPRYEDTARGDAQRRSDEIRAERNERELKKGIEKIAKEKKDKELSILKMDREDAKDALKRQNKLNDERAERERKEVARIREEAELLEEKQKTEKKAILEKELADYKERIKFMDDQNKKFDKHMKDMKVNDPYLYMKIYTSPGLKEELQKITDEYRKDSVYSSEPNDEQGIDTIIQERNDHE